MSYGGQPYAGGAYAGAGMLAADIPVDTEPTFSVEVAFTTDALDPNPTFTDISGDVRSWDVSRGRSRELERFQPGRATIVLDNSDRDYDSQHATGPHFGDLRPMRRIRIRETFSGVTYPRFDGFVDGWNLDYPHGGKDAIATVTATDGFKIFARTELGPSVYFTEVDADSPRLWWRLDEGITATEALNWGSLLTPGDGTYLPAYKLGAEAIIVNDPGSSMESVWPPAQTVAVDAGVKIDDADFDLSDTASWAVEMWIRGTDGASGAATRFWYYEAGVNDAGLAVAANPNSKYVFNVLNSAGTIYGVEHATKFEQGVLHHVVCKKGPSGRLSITVNGVESTTVNGAGGNVFAGSMTVDGDLGCAHTFGSAFNPPALISNFAVYTAADAVDPLPAARITVHYTAGTAPWQGDLPGARAGRVLDLADWPARLRELDAGETTFQSAALGTPVLEHLQKLAETEAGALFVNRAGMVRFISRDALAARVSQATFGDLAPEIGYRSVTFDDGDATIRNRATISRLNGVARTDADAASVAEFGRFQFTLDGLLHDTEAHSVAYADWVTTNYGAPQRRVVSLELGPAAAGNEATLYPQILGRELGDKVTVKVRHPDGTGAVFTQDVIVEGMADQWDPHGFRTARWALSPAPGTF